MHCNNNNKEGPLHWYWSGLAASAAGPIDGNTDPVIALLRRSLCLSHLGESCVCSTHTQSETYREGKRSRCPFLVKIKNENLYLISMIISKKKTENFIRKWEQNRFMRGLQEISQDSVESVKKYFHFLIINIILLTSSAKKEKERQRKNRKERRETRNQNNANLKYEPRKL